VKVITKPKVLFNLMDARRKAKHWNQAQLERAVGSKTGFNNVVAGTTHDMKLGTILRLLDVLGLEMVVRMKEPPAKPPRTYVPTGVLPSGAASPAEGHEA
jgi:transcriptional regulator with XRE-family HTH domain